MTSTSIYLPLVKPTYLYIKQHSITKKKYFGKTTQNPYKYKGSGEYWTNHIKKHGKEYIETLWVSDLYYDTSIVDVALQLSFENNIVESNEWANLEPENGLNGGIPGSKRSEESKAKQSTSTKGVPKSAESNAKRSAAHRGVPKPPRSAESNAKRSASQKGVPKPEGFGAKVSAGKKGKKLKPHSAERNAAKSARMTGVPKSEETKAKMSEAQKDIPKPKFFSIIETRKTYDIQCLSRLYPEFKIYY